MISIVITNYNGKKYLENCLEAIFKSSFTNLEVIVVDDCSKDNSLQLIRRFKQIKLIQNKENLGPSISRNKGATIAQGELLLFLDVDTKIDKKALEKTWKKFREDPQMAAAQGQLILGNSKKLDSIGHFLSPIGFPYEIGSGKEANQFKKKMKILAGKSAGLIVRKSIFDQIKGFDKDYFIYGEDTDLCWRIWQAGYQVYYLPDLKIRHFQKSSLNSKTKYRLFYEGAKNNLSNILKNLSLTRLWWLLPLHIFFWTALALKETITGNPLNTTWIIKGIRWNLFNFSKTLKKRKVTRKLDREILFGKEKASSLIKKGLKWIKNV